MSQKIKICWKKLIIEVVIICCLVSLPSLINFLSWFLRQPVGEREQYNKYKDLYNEVLAFDYENGDRSAIENKIDNATRQIREPILYFFNLYAKATYYCNLGDYQICYDSLEKAADFCPSKDYCRQALELHDFAAEKLNINIEDNTNESQD